MACRGVDTTESLDILSKVLKHDSKSQGTTQSLGMRFGLANVAFTIIMDAYRKYD